MNPKINSVVDVILDRSPEELIGCVLVSLVLAFGVAGLFLLLRRKVSDVSTLIIGLAIISNTLAMTLAGAYIRHQFMEGRRSGTLAGGRPPGHGMSRSGPSFNYPREFRGTFLASRILKEADLNADGVLTADEAATAASQFVKEVEEEAEANEGTLEGLSEGDLRNALRHRLAPPHPGFPPEMGGQPDPIHGPADASGGGREHLSEVHSQGLPESTPSHPEGRTQATHDRSDDAGTGAIPSRR